MTAEPPSIAYSTDRPEWRPHQPGGALEPYVRAIRSHLPLALAIVLAVLLGSVAWLLVRSPVYQSSAQLLVTPVAADSRTYFGLPVVREAGDPVRTLQTAATLADSTDAAALAARRLGDGWTETRVRSAVDVQPQGESSILAVQARATSAQDAVAVANSFARAVVDVRAKALQGAIDKAISDAQSQLKTPGLTPAVQADLNRRVSDLRAIVRGTDPTLAISERAPLPRAAQGVPPSLVILLAIVAGTVLAAGAALLIELVTPQPVTREGDLLSIYPLPVLARLPSERARRRRHGEGPVAPHSRAASEAFRFLQLQLELGKGRPRSVLFTSPSRGDGKTESIVGFARELAAAGRSVILIDLDLREPGVARAFGLSPTRDITALLPSAGRLKRALTPVPGEPSLRIVAAVQQPDGTLLGRLTGLLPDVLDEALRLADYVLIDTPPLGEVGDALQVAGDADEIVIVCRFGNTRARSLETIRDLLERMGRTPTGYLLIGGRVTDTSPYGPAAVDEEPPVEGRDTRRAAARGQGR